MNRRNYLIALCAAIGLFIVIVDTQTAIKGARSGIDICINSLIPTLLPFCFLSKLFASHCMSTKKTRFSCLLNRVGIPDGAGILLLLGYVCGYPFGAQCIEDAYKNGNLSAKDGRHMLAFCNNAGPAFIFGVLGNLFRNTGPLWCIFTIQICSSLAVGRIFCSTPSRKASFSNKHSADPAKIVPECVRSMAIICTWVILFRTGIEFLDRWIFWLLPMHISTTLIGLLELSNGCIRLYEIGTPGLRYILGSVMLASGGCCVALQTFSVSKHIDTGLYIPGKLLQTCIAFLLAYSTQFFLFGKEQQYIAPLPIILVCTLVIAGYLTFMLKTKKVVAFAK